MQYTHIPTTHKRNSSTSTGISSMSYPLSEGGFSSDSDVTSPPTTPSSSRCPSPTSFPSATSSSPLSSPSYSPTAQAEFSLVPRGAPFPEDISLNDIDPTDALLFFPDPTAAPTRAILLVGPAIARHMHTQGKAPSSLALGDQQSRAQTRMHPYRIVVRPSRGERAGREPCAVSRILRGQHSTSVRGQTSSVSSSAAEQRRLKIWRGWARGEELDRAASEEWDALVRPRARADSVSSDSSSSSSF